MRDYKHVKVPRSYRNPPTRVSVKRLDRLSGGRRSAREGGPGIRSLTLQFLTVILIAGGAWLGWQGYQTITHAEMFQISGIDVKGVKQVNEADLTEIAGVFTGKNIFSVDLDAAIRRARANPWIREVRIHRRLPNRINMVVEERVPYAVLNAHSGTFLIDSDGVVISRITKENGGGWRLPSLAVRDAIARPGEPVHAEGLGDALMLIAEVIARGGWQPHEVTVRAGSPETISILYANHEFRIGTGNYEEKLRRLTEVLSDVKQRGVEIVYADLRPERQAAVMVKHEKIRGQGTGSRGRKKA